MIDMVVIFLLLAGGTWLSALVGSAIVIFVKKENIILMDLILGFAAGVILIVSFVELLHPAIHMAKADSGLPAWVIVPGAFALGFFAAFVLDMRINPLKAKKEQSRKTSRYKQGVVLFGALSAHNIPEGLALGILLGTLSNGFTRPELLAVIPLVIAIALHKFPEGAAISIAFKKEGMSAFGSFLLGQTSGFFGFLAGIVGFTIAINIEAILPYAMAFAAGAMVWVVVHELIPESKCNKEKKPYLATMGIFLGVLLMLFVDITLHNHNHGHRPCCYECSLQSQEETLHMSLYVKSNILLFSQQTHSKICPNDLIEISLKQSQRTSKQYKLFDT